MPNDLPSIERWIGERINDDTLDGYVRVEEVYDDDDFIERPASDDDLKPNATDENGAAVEVVEVVVRVLRKRHSDRS